MRADKLTTKFQQALADAQSRALGQDNPYIEPVHVLAAMLDEEDGEAPVTAQTAQQLVQTGHFGWAEAGSGFVEHDQAGAPIGVYP